MHIRKTAAVLIVTLVFVTGTSLATTINVGSSGAFVVSGTTYNLISTSPDYSGLMWEETSSGSGVYKACLCSMLSFRALQAIGQYLGITDMDSAATTIVTGWNTDGPEHIFVDSMGWSSGSGFLYTDPISASSALTLDDAWFTFTISGVTYKVSSLENNYTYIGNTSHAGYHAGWDFFDYRTYFQTHSGNDATKQYFQNVIRGQIVTNFTSGASFDVTPVPEPTTLFSMGCGLVALALAGRRRVQRSFRI